jgi:hypothetical protein
MKWILRHWWIELFGLLGLAGSAAAILWMSKYTPNGAAKDLVSFVGGLMGQGAEHAPAVHSKSAKAAAMAKSGGIDSTSLQGWFASANAMAAASVMAMLRRIVRLFLWWLKVIAFLLLLGAVAAVAYFLGAQGKI